MSYLNELDVHIKGNIESILNMPVGSDERRALVEETIKLMNSSTEYRKCLDDANFKSNQLKTDRGIRYAEIQEKRKDRWTRFWLTVLSTGVMTGVTVWATNGAWRFDRDPNGYMLTSSTGRGWLNKAVDFMYRGMK